MYFFTSSSAAAVIALIIAVSASVVQAVPLDANLGVHSHTKLAHIAICVRLKSLANAGQSAHLRRQLVNTEVNKNKILENAPVLSKVTDSAFVQGNKKDRRQLVNTEINKNKILENAPVLSKVTDSAFVQGNKKDRRQL
ncbi:hypothetical protein THASP1DRAFT_26377, partial [Thamnocephalis sphaerospora]